MAENAQTQFNAKIYKTDTKGKTIDFQDMKCFEDPERPGKITLSFTEYDPNKVKPTVYHRHYVDVAVMRVVCNDILNENFGTLNSKGTLLEDRGGGPASAEKITTCEFLARKLTIAYKTIAPDGTALRQGPSVSFGFETCPGRKDDKGLFVPDGPCIKSGFIMVTLPVAKRIAIEIISYLQAKQTLLLVKNSQ